MFIACGSGGDDPEGTQPTTTPLSCADFDGTPFAVFTEDSSVNTKSELLVAKLDGVR